MDATGASAVDWDPLAYDRLARPHVEWGRRVLARLELSGSDTTLDAGCGTGTLSRLLLEQSPNVRVIAADVSAAMLDAAKQKLGQKYGTRVSFVHVDLTHLELEREVDIIFSSATFHWVRDHDTLFRVLFRALKPGGRYAQFGGGPNLARLRAHLSAVMARPAFTETFSGWVNPWVDSDPGTTTERLRAAGFTDVVTAHEAAPTVLEDETSYREFLCNLILRSYVAALPDYKTRTRFVNEPVTEAADDGHTIDYWRLNVAATRPR